VSTTYTLSKRKSISEEMGYQPGKLYEVCDLHNKKNTSWMYWKSSEYHTNVFKAAIGAIKVGDAVVFLGEENNFYKLLLADGTLAFVTHVGDLVLKPL